MIYFLVVLLLFGVCVVAILRMNGDVETLQRISENERRLRETMNEVEGLARQHYELNPLMAQCILDEINMYHLGKNEKELK